MKKKTRILSTILAAVICSCVYIGSLPNFADAAAYPTYDIELPNGYDDYTFVGYTGHWMGSEYYSSVLYQKPEESSTKLFELTLYYTNCTTLTLSEDGLETFEEIYAEYEDTLDFDYCETGGSSPFIVDDTYIEEVRVYLYDRAPISETIPDEQLEFTVKKDILVTFCDVLDEADVLLSAEYHYTNWCGQDGYYDQTIIFTGAPEGETEQIQEIVSAYDDDAVVTETSADETGTIYTISPVEDYNVSNEIRTVLLTEYSGTSVIKYCEFLDSSSDVQTSSIDLLAEEIALYGDMDGDEEISLNDAYLIQAAFADEAAGLDSGFTDTQKTAADIDGDGVIAIKDAYYMMMYFVSQSAGNAVSWEEIIG